MAWEGLINAYDAARESNQQIVESEHLMKALLEQKDGMARRVFAKAGIDNSSVLQATDLFISKQPTVFALSFFFLCVSSEHNFNCNFNLILQVSDTGGQRLGSSLSVILENAKRHKKDMLDSYVSVEHLLLAFYSDARFGQEFFKNMKLDMQVLKDAIKDVRGSQRVTDQSKFCVGTLMMF